MIHKIKGLVQAGANKMGYEIRRLPVESSINAQEEQPFRRDTYLLGRVHKKDGMFQGDAGHYIRVGLDAIKNIEESLQNRRENFCGCFGLFGSAVWVWSRFKVLEIED